MSLQPPACPRHALVSALWSPVTACTPHMSLSRGPSLTAPLLSSLHCLDVGGTYFKLRGEINGRQSPGTKWDLSF